MNEKPATPDKFEYYTVHIDRQIRYIPRDTDSNELVFKKQFLKATQFIQNRVLDITTQIIPHSTASLTTIDYPIEHSVHNLTLVSDTPQTPKPAFLAKYGQSFSSNELWNMTNDELRVLCLRNKIKYYYKMTKQDMVDSLLNKWSAF